MSGEPKTLSTMGDDLDRGLRFGSALFETVHEFGPSQLSAAEKEALGHYLLTSAVEWVKARNRVGAVALLSAPPIKGEG